MERSCNLLLPRTNYPRPYPRNIFILSTPPLFSLVLYYFPSFRFAIAFNTSLIVYQDSFLFIYPLLSADTPSFPRLCLFPSRASKCAPHFYFVSPSLPTSLSPSLFLCFWLSSALSLYARTLSAACVLFPFPYILLKIPKFLIAHLHYYVFLAV